MKSSARKCNDFSARASSFLPQTPEVIIVDERLTFDGNLVPHAWLNRITTNVGSADVIACMVLAEIVYWYRGTDVIEGGKVIGRKRKFSGDYLQKSYSDLATKLNLTKGQVTDAVKRLEERNLIKRDFRTLNVRGVKISNVLFIQLFAWTLVNISKPVEVTAEPSGETERKGYGEKSGDPSENFGGDPRSTAGRSAGITADKYTDHDKDPAEDHVPGAETSTAAESAKPTPTEFSSNSTENTGTASFKPGETQSGMREKVAPKDPVHSPQDCSTGSQRRYDKTAIRSVLEQAFGGLKFSGRNEATLQSYIKEGRITLGWAKALLMAKQNFDQNREHFKARKIFIPVKPMYVIRDYDRTTEGILRILNEKYAKFDEITTVHDHDSLEPYLQLIQQYDDYFVKIHRGRWEGGRFVTIPGHEDDLEKLLLHPHSFFDYKEGDVVLPAWMRIAYACQRNVCTERLDRALLTKAQEELRTNPTGLSAMPEPLSDEKIQVVFRIDAADLRQRWTKENEQREKILEELETLITEVAETSSAAENSNIS